MSDHCPSGKWNNSAERPVAVVQDHEQRQMDSSWSRQVSPPSLGPPDIQEPF